MTAARENKNGYVIERCPRGMLAAVREMGVEAPEKDAALAGARWRWQYLESPFARESAPTVLVARNGSNYCGRIGMMMSPVRCGENTLLGAYGTNLLVLPEHRGQGVGHLLCEAWEERCGVAMALGISPMSFPLFGKRVWNYLGLVPRMVCHLREKPRFRHLLKLSPARNCMAVLRGRCGTAGMARPAGDISEVKQFDQDADQLAVECPKQIQAQILRNRDYLNWKYVRQPGRQYTIFRLAGNSCGSGYLVARLEAGAGAPVGLLVDFVAPVQAFQVLAAHALKHFADAGAERVECLLLGAPYQRALERLGFVYGRSWTRFMVKPHRSVPNSRLLTTRRSWLVTGGDSDQDRPRE